MSKKVYQVVKEINKDIASLKQHLKELHKALDKAGLIPENPINIQMFYVDDDSDYFFESIQKLNETLGVGFQERNRFKKRKPNPGKKDGTRPS